VAPSRGKFYFVSFSGYACQGRLECYIKTANIYERTLHFKLRFSLELEENRLAEEVAGNVRALLVQNNTVH
jgi:hypothetical protein